MDDKKADQIITLLKQISSKLDDVAMFVGNTDELVHDIKSDLKEVLNVGEGE